MPKGAIYEEIVRPRRLGDGERFIPPTEADERKPRQMSQARRFEDFLRTAIVVEGISSGFVRRVKSIFAAAFEELRPPEEMHVVRVIHTRTKHQRAAIAGVNGDEFE